MARLAVQTIDPENRNFRHRDVVAWTEANRGRLLAALYTILIGNPRLRGETAAPPETRFKLWWHIIGSALEHAANQHKLHVDAMVIDAHPECKPERISFRKLFLDGEGEDEQTSNLAIVLSTMIREWPEGTTSNAVSAYILRQTLESIEFKSALEQASGKALTVLSPTTIAWRLKAIKDSPVQIGDSVYMLKYTSDHRGGTFIVRKVR